MESRGLDDIFVCAGSSESVYFAHVRRHMFPWGGPVDTFQEGRCTVFQLADRICHNEKAVLTSTHNLCFE